MPRPRREPPTVEHLIEVLRNDLFAAPAYALLANVRSATGADVPNLRIADLVAVDTREGSGPELVLHALEIKRSAADLARELSDPSKADEIGRFCDFFTLVLPAPVKLYLGARLALPKGWGLIEVTGPRAAWLVHPTPRSPEPRPTGFLRSLFRAAAAPVGAELAGEGLAPMRAIVERIDRDFVRLGPCGHRALRPLDKRPPSGVPCWECAAEREQAREARPGPASCGAPEVEPARAAEVA